VSILDTAAVELITQYELGKSCWVY